MRGPGGLGGGHSAATSVFLAGLPAHAACRAPAHT